MITGVILAAGTSSRMGRPKQLLDLGGKPVLQHVVDAADRSVLDRILLVLGHQAEEVASAIRRPSRLTIAVNPDFELGQSTSLRAGIRGVSPGANAVLVLLGDQPGIRPDAIDAVVSAYRSGAGSVVQASYSGRPAHPTLFDRSLWPELEQLTGDEGARSLIGRHPDRRILVEVGGLPPFDIDTEEDLEGARAALQGP